MSSDIFEEVPPNDILMLLEVFSRDWNRYYPLNQYVKIMREYNEADIIIPKQCLYRHGNVEDGVYLFKSYFDLGNISYTIFHIYTASKDYSDLEKALSETERIPWFTHSYVFQATLKRFAPVIRKVAGDKGLEMKWTEEDLLWLLPEVPLDIGEVPLDMELRFLQHHHAKLMDIHWKSKFPGSGKYLAIQISNNFGLGLFRKSDGKLVCSAVTYNSGGIFCLFTDQECRGKGYAEVIVRSLAKELRHRKRIPFATVHGENIPSQKVFRRTGFTDFSKMEFITSPNHYKEHESTPTSSTC